MNTGMIQYNKNRRMICLFLIGCLWLMQVQADHNRSLAFVKTMCRETILVSSNAKMLVPDADLHRIIEIFRKAAEESRSGACYRQNILAFSAAAASVFLLSACKHLQIYRAVPLHLHFFHTLIRYIQKQNGL
ncbi:MAG: hypothetical protein IJW67_04165 [Blautia sp.]|nr:hypothetical protein [Blautia sp.]